MMEGINVLSQTPIYYNNLVYISIFLLIVGFAVFLISANFKVMSTFFIGSIMSLIGAVMVITILLLGVGNYETGEYTYKVTIDETVKMNEFNEKYVVIGKEGKIYTIREKDKENE